MKLLADLHKSGKIILSQKILYSVKGETTMEEKRKESVFRIYHVLRHAVLHSRELDDKLYGSPVVKPETDWALKDPRLYLQRLKSELRKVETALDDLSYLINLKGFSSQVPEAPEFTLEEAALHIYHDFYDIRQFTYVELLQYELQNRMPENILYDVNLSKARRQFNVLLAGREDLIVSIVRFSAYADDMEKAKG